MLAFFVPTLSLGLDETKYSTEFFNPADPTNPTSTLVVGSATANYEVFSLRKFAELGRTKAELASAEAGELEQRFQAALETESAYYDVLVNGELARVGGRAVAPGPSGSERRPGEGLVRRGGADRLASARARAAPAPKWICWFGGTRCAPRSSSWAGGWASRGRSDAVPLDTMPAPDLPIALPEALQSALDQGPQYRTARANERAAEASLKSRRSDYFPSLGIGALHQRYDTEIFPGAAKVTSVTFSLSFPIWNNGLREIETSRARVARDVARTIREDLERAVRRDVVSAFDTYESSREAARLAGVGVTVARENYRMQEMRYRAGASTILDLLDSQVSLAEAEAGLVQARYVTRLSLARLEAILGRRLFSNKDAP